MIWKLRSGMLVGLLLTAMALHGMAQIVTTQVTDTIYNADGTAASGTVIVSWPAFTTSAGQSVPSGSTSASIGAGGALSLALAPNAGSNPMGSYYTAVYHLANGAVSREYWVVPTSSAAVQLSTIRSTVLPTSVAMQTVSKSYVDTAIARATGGVTAQDASGYVLKSGDTMTGPLVLPGDPVSAQQAADKNYVDTSVASVGGGGGQKVSTVPSATQVVVQPTGTQLDVNNLNAVEYARQYVNGNGGNGIANAVASTDCASGCEVKVEQDYASAETFAAAALSSQTHVKDTRGGGQTDTYFNPVDLVQHGQSTGQTITTVATQSEASLFQATGNQDPGSVALAVKHQVLAGGSNLLPGDIDAAVPYFKMEYSALQVDGTYNAAGQHVMVPETMHCYGVGDCLIGSRFIYASGGFRDNADEATHPFDLETAEDPQVFTGTCSSGCTTGATILQVATTAAPGTQGEGRFLIDKNPAKVITAGTLISGTNANPHPTAVFVGSSFAVSVFLSTAQRIVSQANNVAPGTVTVSIATSGQPSGYATSTAAIGHSSGVACVVDQSNAFAAHNYEMATYTVIDATHLQMTLNKPHQTLATIAFGGLCGYGLEETVDTVNGIRQVFPVVGSYSASGLYYAGHETPIVGVNRTPGGYVNASAPIASLVRSANLVTVTTAGNLPADLNGLTVTVAGVGDSSYNGGYLITTIAANKFTYAQTGANSTSTGGTVSLLTGGFALYPMAEVLSVFNQTTHAIDGQMTLAANTVPWAPSDSVEQPHYYEENVYGDMHFIRQTTPRPAIYDRNGVTYQGNTGPGMRGWSVSNTTPTSNYLGYGGTHSAPDAAIEAYGIWKQTMTLGAGEQALFAVQCNLHGCGNWNSGYDLFELDNSTGGFDTVNFSPVTSTLSINLRGTSYSFSPQAFTAATLNIGTLNATTINGGFSGSIIGGSVDGAVIGATTPAAVNATSLNGVPVSEYANVARKPMVTFLQALHNARNQVVNLVVIGDSFGLCDYTNCVTGPTISTNRWTEQMRINLQAQFGSHGTGMVPLTYSVGSHINSEVWSVSGGWDTSTGTLGPSQGGGNPGNGLVHLGNGAVATFTSAIPYDTINTYCMTAGSSGSLAVKIDGVTVGSACGATTSNATAHVVTSSSVGLATHTATFTSTGDSYLYAAEGTAGTTGVSLHNLSVGGATSQFFGASPASELAFSDLIPGGTQGVVTMLQTNDAAFALPIASFSANMSAIVTHELGLTGSPSVLVAVPPVDAVGASGSLVPYSAAQVALAQTQNVAFVNVQDRWGAAYVSTSGLWDLGPTNPGIHPNDKGSLDEYSILYAQLVDPVVFGGGGSGGAVSSVTTAGSGGPATLSGGVLNIPQYGGAAMAPFYELNKWPSNDGGGSTLSDKGSGVRSAMTATNVTWSSASGFSGSIAHYNGSSSAVAANQANTNFDGTTPFSACLWVNPASLTPADQYVLGTLQITDTGIPGWGLELANIGGVGNPASPHVQLINSIGANQISVFGPANSLTTGTANYVCFTYTGSKTAAGVALYVNGSPVASTVTEDNLTGSMANTNTVMLGAIRNGSSLAGQFNGAEGYVGIYNRVLGPGEIANLYAGGPQ